MGKKQEGGKWDGTRKERRGGSIGGESVGVVVYLLARARVHFAAKKKPHT